MAHLEQIEFLKLVHQLFPDCFSYKKVLEIGSLDINGSVREFFTKCDYLGVDVGPGDGVDVVCQAQDYDAPTASFDTVICCEVMEHNPYWKETFINMFRLCKPGGLIIMSCASTGRPEHGTTRTSPEESPLTIAIGWDYYRNLTGREFQRAINIGDLTETFRFFRNWNSCDLYFIGFRRGVDIVPGTQQKLNQMKRHYEWECVRAVWRELKMRLLIAIFGEERYRAGPIRFW